MTQVEVADRVERPTQETYPAPGRRSIRFHVLWIGIWSGIGWAATAASPLMMSEPVWLMALSPRLAFAALASDKLGLLPFVALGLIRLSLTDASWFIVGRHFGGKTASRARRLNLFRLAERVTERARRSSVLCAAVLFARPNGRYLALASANGTGGVLAAAASLSGTVAYLMLLHQGAQWALH